MKRRIVATALALAMICSMVVSAPAIAAEDPAYKMTLVGTEGTFEATNGLNMTMRMKTAGNTAGAVTNVNLRIDSSKLKLVSMSTGDDLEIKTSYGDKLYAGTKQKPSFDTYSASTVSGYAMKLNDQYTIFRFELTFDAGTNLATAHGTDAVVDGEYEELYFALGFVGDTTVDDLDMASIMLVEPEVAGAAGQSYTAVIRNNGDVVGYGSTDVNNVWQKDQDRLAKPTLIFPNSTDMNLNGVKLDGVNKYVNVPVSLPDAGADVTVATTPTGYYTSDCADGTEITSGVTYTYGLQIKDDTEGATARDLTDDEKAVLSVSTDGVVTVKAGAPQATLVVSATGAYNNGKNDSTAVGTYEIGLRHGDAHSKNEEDPSVPPKPVGGEPSDKDADKTASGVAIYENVDGVETQVTISGSTTPYSKGMAIPAVGAEAKTATFVGKVVDQYGDPMNTETGTWSVTKDSAAYTDTNPTFANGVVTVASGAAKGEYEYKFTSGAYNAAVEINIDDSIITWPTLTTDTIVYGQAVSEFAPTGGSIEPLAEGATAEFVWATNGTEEGAPAIDDDTVLDAGKYTLVMQCKVGETVKGTHNYSVTVGKANQVITIAGDTDEAKRESLAIPRGGDGFDLQTKVTNETVPTATGTSNPTYAIADAETAVMGTETDKLNVITGLKINNDGTKLTITAAANDNYNEATRELTVKVGKELLDAQITLTPADNLKYGETVTATVVENPAQSGSLTKDTDYQWFRVTPATDTTEEVATPIGATGKLLKEDGSMNDLTYTATVEDIGHLLRFVVSTGTTDASNPSYDYADKSIATMTNPVGYASWGSISGVVKTVTTKTVTVEGQENAWFAIALKNAPAVAAESDEPASDGHTWVESVDGADVEFTQDDAGNALTPNTEYTVFMKKVKDGYETATTTFDAKTDRISINDETDTDSPKGGKVELSGKAFVGETLTAVITDPVLGEGETAETKTVLSTGDIRWYRVTPAADESSEETTEEITGAAGNTTYTVDAADTDKIIRVVVTTKADAAYSGSVQAETAKVVNGHNISGVVKTFNAKNAVEYELYKMREDGTYAEPNKETPTYDYHGIAVAAEDTTTNVEQIQNFTIEGVADGTYKLVISKKAHADFVILNLVINGDDIHFETSENAKLAVIRLGPGEVDGSRDNKINDADQSFVIRSDNYSPPAITTPDQEMCDIDGDGKVNDADQSIILRSENYSRTTANDFTVDLAIAE